MGEIVFKTGHSVSEDKVRAYFEIVLNAERSGEEFPVDFDTVWPIAYTTKSNAKRALVDSSEFFDTVDYQLIQNDELPQRPPGNGGAGWNREKIYLSVQCLEFFVARKLRPVFEIYRQCRIAATKAAQPKAVMPYHIRRYVANHDQVPFGFFSILQEITMKLIGPLEIHGYTLPSNMVPDISVGKIFCKWLRDEKGINPEEFPSYQHTYEDGRVISARLYPLTLLSDFVTHFQEEWIKNRAEKYFKERDQTALEYLPRILKLPPNRNELPDSLDA